MKSLPSPQRPLCITIFHAGLILLAGMLTLAFVCLDDVGDARAGWAVEYLHINGGQVATPNASILY